MRTVQKIKPSRPSSFDQQFWPVVVALTVLCGIGVGAIVTLLHGPWLWGSLLILPVASAVALYLLFLLDESKLRRSLQLAILTSLAAHLLVMIFASVVHIFQNPYQQPDKAVSQRQERTIEISDRRASFVWEETNHRETPEPNIVAEREQKTTTDVKPQPVPVSETKPSVQPQLIRRETPAQTLPRQDKSLSQLRRQTQNQQPRSSQPNLAVRASSQPNRQSELQESTPQAANPNEASASVERQTEPVPASAAARTAPNAENKKDSIAIADASPRRASPSKLVTESVPQSSPSSARKTAESPTIPIVKNQQTLPAEKNTIVKNQSKPQPSPTAAEITRRQTASTTVSPSVAIAKESSASPQPQIARSAQRRSTNQTAPTISVEASKQTTPRRSTRDSQLTASPIPIENPMRQPDSQSNSQELQAKTLSVSRSTEGVAGAGRSANLETATGGMTSPATVPSDSASRRRTENAPTEFRQLATSTRSTARRAAGTAPQPTSAFTADTTATAKISGSTTPTDRSVESSAARIDSATADRRGDVSVEKGSTNVDLGPTKIVADATQSNRRSGGGQPEVSQLNPDSTQRSRSTDNQQPTLVADAGQEAMAQSTQMSAPVSSELEPNAETTSVARSGGEEAITFERDAAATAGEFANAGDSDLATNLSDSRQRSQRNDETTAYFSNDDDEEDDEEEHNRGSAQSRLALAPVIRGAAGAGNFKTDLGSNRMHSERSADVPSESIVTTLQRTATSAMPGSGIGRSATSLLLRAATSLPVIESTAPRRSNGRTSAGDVTAEIDNNTPIELVNNVSHSRSLTAPSAQPTLTLSTANNLPASKSNIGTNSNFEFEPNEAELERPAVDFSEQGASMEIIAMEGPAGLADRPDDYLGVMTRPASRDSLQIQPDLDQRFRNITFGGTPAINPDAVLANDAFRQRSPAALASAAEPTTEAAIQLGLEFLARHQTADGSWSLSSFDMDHPQHASQLNSDTAATALAILSFQGAGYNHREFKYARVVNHGVQWLVEHQQENGSLYVPADAKSDGACRLYSHGIAALALTEAFGMTQDIQIQAAAQKAIDYIVETQDPRKGGWRYFDDPKMKSSDTSVTGWMMMALQSGRLAGLEVDDAVFKGIDQWLDVAADPDEPTQYRYNPYAMDSDGVSRLQGRQPTASMTSVGLLMRIYSGWDRNDPVLLDGATFLVLQHLPGDASPQQRDTYYWYYATQVLKHIDGPLWEKWDGQLRPLLIRSQMKTGDLAGSWHPYNPIPDRWGSFGGRLYVTTMNLLSLEVRHRMLPLYQKTNEEGRKPEN